MLLGLLKITRGVMKKKLIKLTDNEIKILLSKLDGWSSHTDDSENKDF